MKGYHGTMLSTELWCGLFMLGVVTVREVEALVCPCASGTWVVEVPRSLRCQVKLRDPSLLAKTASGSLTDEQLDAECIESFVDTSQLVVHFHRYEPCQGHPVRDHGLIEDTRIKLREKKSSIWPDVPTRECGKPATQRRRRRGGCSLRRQRHRRGGPPLERRPSSLSPQMAKALTTALQEYKLIASFFLAGSKGYSSGALCGIPPREIIKPGYNFGRQPFGPAHGIQVSKGSDGLPKYVNWLDVPGVVFQSKKQRHCGSCYIVAGLSSISSLNWLTNKSRYHLSAQHILDGNTITNFGCEGSWTENVFDYIIRNGGVVPEADYPYNGIRGVCKTVEAEGVTIAKWAAVEPTDEAVKYAVAFQPVVSSIYVNSNFMRYIKGLLKVPDEHGPPNHSVLLLGYGECPHEGEYWVRMNSYRRKWGMK